MFVLFKVSACRYVSDKIVCGSIDEQGPDSDTPDEVTKTSNLVPILLGTGSGMVVIAVIGLAASFLMANRNRTAQKQAHELV